MEELTPLPIGISTPSDRVNLPSGSGQVIPQPSQHQTNTVIIKQHITHETTAHSKL